MMNIQHDQYSISGAGSADTTAAQANADSSASFSGAGESYIEIRGREGSKTVYRKKVNNRLAHP